jgi:hypothetical protein
MAIRQAHRFDQAQRGWRKAPVMFGNEWTLAPIATACLEGSADPD